MSLSEARKCSACGEEFVPGVAKPGLIHECWQCGAQREAEAGIKLKREPVYVPAWGNRSFAVDYLHANSTWSD